MGRHTTRCNAPTASGGAVLLAKAMAVLGVGLLLAACQSRSVVTPVVDNRLHDGEILVGRVTDAGAPQEFVFEGVESSMLHFTVWPDVQSTSDSERFRAPSAQVYDPDGQALPVSTHVRTNRGGGSAFVVRDLVLTKTGPYKVVVTPSENMPPGGFYRFKHGLTFPAPLPRRVYLSAEKPQPVYFSAPRRGTVTMTVCPVGKCSCVVPEIIAVKDRNGAPALDRSRTPCGRPLPMIGRDKQGRLTMTFVATEPGTHEVLVAAKPGQPGYGVVGLMVQPCPQPNREVRHPGASPFQRGPFQRGLSSQRVTPTAAGAPRARRPMAVASDNPCPCARDRADDGWASPAQPIATR